MPRMIVDVHTHVFPPRTVERREGLAAADPGFAELYGSPAAKMATAGELLASMDRAGVDVAVAAGFWWGDAATAEEHASYLLEVAAASAGRIVPFVPVTAATDDAALRTLLEGGARGLGEVRPGDEAAGAPVDEALTAMLTRATGDLELPLLLHSSEEVGHQYPGKSGGYTPGALWQLIESCTDPRSRVIAGHWGGGFPFYALMPEVRAVLASGRLAFDSAASPLLYDPAVFAQSLALVGSEHVLWGSDYPLRDQARDRAAVEAAIDGDADRAAVLGANAERFLSL